VKITEKRLKQIIKEELDMHSSHLEHPDKEGGMAKRQLEHISEYAHELAGMLDENTQLESWVQSKITLAQDYISKVKHYLENELGMSAVGCGPSEPVEDFIVNDNEMIALTEE
jgi:uncharacterized protein with PhoU and TrkA domain